MFDFLSFGALETQVISWLGVIAIPLALAIGIGLAMMILSWIMHGVFGSSGGDGSAGSVGSAGADGSAGSAGRMQTRRIRAGGRRGRGESEHSRQEWAMLEQHAREVNGWDGEYH